MNGEIKEKFILPKAAFLSELKSLLVAENLHL
jgi:hypothetical protein